MRNSARIVAVLLAFALPLAMTGRAKAQITIGESGGGGAGKVGLWTFSLEPAVTATGDHIVVCAVNVTGFNPPPVISQPSADTNSDPSNRSSLSVTLGILNAVTGAVLSSQQLTLPPLGSTDEPPDPCVTYVVPETVASESLFVIGVIALSSQPLSPGIVVGLRSSLEIYTLDANENPTNVRIMALLPPDPCRACVELRN